MDKDLLKRLEQNELRCSKCNLIIPFTFKRTKKQGNPEFTIPSFTLVDSKPVCYRDYHPDDLAERF
jgi:hypothetical protein